MPTITSKRRSTTWELAAKTLLLEKDRLTGIFAQSSTLGRTLSTSRSLNTLLTTGDKASGDQLRKELVTFLVRTEAISAITLTSDTGRLLCAVSRTGEEVTSRPGKMLNARRKSPHSPAAARECDPKRPRIVRAVLNKERPVLRYRSCHRLSAAPQRSYSLSIDFDADKIFGSIGDITPPTVSIFAVNTAGSILYDSSAPRKGISGFAAAGGDPDTSPGRGVPVRKQKKSSDHHCRSADITIGSDGSTEPLMTLTAAINGKELHTGLASELRLLAEERSRLFLLIIVTSLLAAGFLFTTALCRCVGNTFEAAAATGNGVVVLNSDFTVSDFNDTAQEYTGLSTHQLCGRHLSKLGLELSARPDITEIREIVAEEGEWCGRGTLTGRDGSVRHISVCIRNLGRSGSIDKGAIASFVDISQELEVENNLLLRTEIDPLTRCWNRRTFLSELDNQLDLISRYQHQCCLAVLDVDNFGRVNERYGRLTGNGCLRDIGTLIRDNLRSIDIIARFHGDFFAILLPCTTAFDAVERLGTIRQHLRRRDGLRLTASIGVVQLSPAEDRNQSLDLVTAALQQAKEQGKDQLILVPPKEG